MRGEYDIYAVFGSDKVKRKCRNVHTSNVNMARIMIGNWGGKSLEVSDLSKTLLRHLHDSGLDWMHSCGAKGRCTSCKAIVLQGDGHLSTPTPAEEKYRRMGALRNNERLACQVKISGDVVIAVPDENKLPHISYD